MAGTDYDDVLAAVRRRIREPSAIEWTDAELFSLISDEERRLWDERALLPGAGTDLYQDEISIAAAVTSFSLVTGAPPTALTKEFVAIEALDWKNNGIWTPLQEFQAADEWQYDTQDDSSGSSSVKPSYRISGTTLIAKPEADAARTYRLTYLWRPPVKDNVSPTTDTLDTPPRWDEIIVIRAASRALEKLGQTDDRLETRVLMLVAEMEAVEVNKQPRGRVETVQRTSTAHWRR